MVSFKLKLVRLEKKQSVYDAQTRKNANPALDCLAQTMQIIIAVHLP